MLHNRDHTTDSTVVSQTVWKSSVLRMESCHYRYVIHSADLQ